MRITSPNQGADPSQWGQSRLLFSSSKQLAKVWRLPMCNRAAIHSRVITVSSRSRAAIRTFSPSVLRRRSSSAALQPGGVGSLIRDVRRRASFGTDSLTANLR